MIKSSTPVSNNKHPWPRVYGLSEHGEWITLFPLDVVPLGQGSGEGKKCYGAALIYSWGSGLNGSMGPWRYLSALGAWKQTCLMEAEEVCLMESPRGLRPDLHNAPCSMGGTTVQDLVPLPSMLQPLAVLDIWLWSIKTPCDAVEYYARKGLGKRTWGQAGAEPLPGTT